MPFANRVTLWTALAMLLLAAGECAADRVLSGSGGYTPIGPGIGSGGMPDAYAFCYDCGAMYGPQDQRCKGLLKACENTFFRIRNRFASTGPPTGTVPPLASLVTKGVNDALGLLCCEEDINVTEGTLITDVVQVNYLARYEQLTHLPVYVNDLFRRCNLERIQLLNGKMLVAPGVTKLRSICMNLPSPCK